MYRNTFCVCCGPLMMSGKQAASWDVMRSCGSLLWNAAPSTPATKGQVASRNCQNKAKMSLRSKHNGPFSPGFQEFICTELLQLDEPTLTSPFVYFIYIHIKYNTYAFLCPLPRRCLWTTPHFRLWSAPRVKDSCWTHAGDICSTERFHS